MYLIVIAIVIAVVVAAYLTKKAPEQKVEEPVAPEPTPLPQEEPIIIPAPEEEKPKRVKKTIAKAEPKLKAVKKKSK